MTITAMEAYKMFHALKLHFTSDTYDYHKYNGGFKIDPETFNQKRDRFFFYKLVKKVDSNNLESYLLANLVSNQIGRAHV